MFIPTNKDEMRQLGWGGLDVILVTGDTYIDSPNIGVAVIANHLVKHGYRVGIVAQPDVSSDINITKLGEPELFWGVTAGSMDSMISNYTAIKKRRQHDDFTPGGINKRRPDRASIAYTNLIRRYFKNTRPIILGGIEASLRRIAHYDYWDNAIRRSILFDAKADILVYGMAERTVLQIAERLSNGTDLRDVRGICYIDKKQREGYLRLPSFEEVRDNKTLFAEMFHLFYQNNDPLTSMGLCQPHGDRYLIHNPPPPTQTEAELDAIYELPFERDVHPYYKRQGTVRAMDTIRFSVTTHRGCYGECNFCSIALHQGRTVVSRSIESIVKELKAIGSMPEFKGYISDIGGPTANMYKIECKNKLIQGACKDRRCLYPSICKHLKIDHTAQIGLLKRARAIKGIKKAFVASGLRYDMVMEDAKHGMAYLKELLSYHLSGQLKVAPEHTEDMVLKRMGKTGSHYLLDFKSAFDRVNSELGLRQFLTYYFIAAHPGCDEQAMRRLKGFIQRNIKITPEQVQVFTPLPSTYSSLMYHTGRDPFTGEAIYVEMDMRKKQRQKEIISTNNLKNKHCGMI